jgi:hypothetical protein
MKKLISAKSAANVLLVAMGALAVFHVLVLAKVLPSDIVWGGRMGVTPDINLFVLETTALVITLLFALIIAAKAGYVRLPFFTRSIPAAKWVTWESSPVSPQL